MIFVRYIEESLDKEKKPIDWAMWFFSIAGPLSTLPQILQIFIEKKAEGVSILSWVLYLIISLSAIAYAIVHRQMVILVSNIVWSLTYLVVIIGAVIYG